MYFQESFPAEFGISSNTDLINSPELILPQNPAAVPAPGKPLTGQAFKHFVEQVTEKIAVALDLKGE